MYNAVLGLETNVGNRIENFKKAVDNISSLLNTKVIKTSNVYETEQVGYEGQDKFLNLNVIIETELSPTVLLGACLAIESFMGRERNIKDGPRIIDIDILLYESVRMDTFELALPHPRMLERAFILKPLLDLYPTGRATGMFFLPRLNSLGLDGVNLYEDKISLL